MHHKLFVSLTTLLYGIFALHLGALFFSWYWQFWWFDIVMHTLGGAWVGGMALWWYIYVYRKNTPTVGAVYWVSFVTIIVIGGLWELFEFGVDTFISFKQNDILDTTSDMFSDIAGGLIASFYTWRLLLHDKHN